MPEGESSEAPAPPEKLKLLQRRKAQQEPKKPPEHPKQVWFLSFGASSPDITAEMLAACGLGGDVVREIHIMSWRESKYVLLSLDRCGRMRTPQMKAVVDRMQGLYHTVSNEIVGYDSITGNSAAKKDEGIVDHPGFRRMLEALSGKTADGKQQDGTSTAVRSWTKDGVDDARRKRGRGFLKRMVGETEIDSMSKLQLKRLCHKSEPLLEELQRFKEAHNALHRRLEHHESCNRMLEGANEILRIQLDLANKEVGMLSQRLEAVTAAAAQAAAARIDNEVW